jgi:signal transduction histidine kinase
VRVFIVQCFILLFLINNSYSQHQKEADSLLNVFYKNTSAHDSIQTNLLYLITIKSSVPEEKLKYADILLERSRSYKPVYYSIQAYNIKGVAYRLKGDLENALKNLFKSAKLAADNNFPVFEAEAYSEISNTYIANKDFNNSLIYQRKAITVFRAHSMKEQLPIALLNTGFNYYSLQKLDTALQLYNEAEPLFEEINMTIGKAYVIGNRALVYWKQGKYKQAEQDLIRAIAMLKPLGDQFGMADYHNQLGNIYLEENNIEKAIYHTQKSMSMSKDLGLKEQIRDATLLLSKLYQKKKEFKKAFEYQSQYLVYKDSIESKEKTKKIADIRTDFEVSLREKEIDLLEKKDRLNATYIIIAFALLALSVILLLYFRQRFATAKLITIHQKKEHDDKIEDLLKAQETKVLQSMIKGKDNERKRLAQELHNHLGSLLATVKVNINRIEEEAIPNHETLVNLVDQACNDVRNMSHSLHMGVSEDFGLVSALQELTIHLRQSNEMKVEFSASMHDGIIDSESEIVIYRIVQELVSNVLKHSQSTKLSIILTYFEEESLMNILVQDNGKGFDTEKDFRGMGLNSIKKIVAHFEGEISFDSNAESGSTVNIDLPISTQTNLI